MSLYIYISHNSNYLRKISKMRLWIYIKVCFISFIFILICGTKKNVFFWIFPKNNVSSMRFCKIGIKMAHFCNYFLKWAFLVNKPIVFNHLKSNLYSTLYLNLITSKWAFLVRFFFSINNLFIYGPVPFFFPDWFTYFCLFLLSPSIERNREKGSVNFTLKN